ncbi:MAG: hypothetical protein ACRC8S_14525 [Fimbriiglobus sp.]
MKFGASRSHLYDAQKTARARWDVVCEDWQDETQRHFEERIWQPLDQMTTDALRGIDQLAVLFTQIRQDCEFQ